MALALIVLAIGSVLAGYVGVPHALGGHNQLAAWLEPAFEARPGTGGEAEGVATPTEEPGAAVGEAQADAGHAEAAGEGGDETALERTLMGVSSAIAVVGILIAWFIWITRRHLADSMARSFAPVHRLLLNKYYVDEVYDATVVNPIRVVSQEGLWRGFDVKVIDGAVNGTAAVVGGLAATMRRLQTGSVRAYAGSLFVGVVLVLGYYLWR
jgi:NADH-quinone oxidoreductase subunit L